MHHSHLQQRANEFQVFESPGCKFANHQIMRFEAECGNPAGRSGLRRRNHPTGRLANSGATTSA
jgi:hypothetical protein